jgi:hypothetical protein
MKTLYESILDDEDILINDVKKTIDNIFVYILSSTVNGMSWWDFMDGLDKYTDEIISHFPSLKKSKYKFEFNSERKTYNDGKRIIWLEADIPNYDVDRKTIFFIILRDDNKMCLRFNRQWDFGTKLRNRVDRKSYDKDINEFSKKNNFTQINLYDSFKQMN